MTATFTVNFKYVRKNNSYYMWETSDEATIRSITGNGLNLSLSHTMTIPNSYDTQGNLSASQAAEIQSLIGRSDGKVYMVNYTRTIRVYTPANLSSTGQKVYHGSFDGGSDSAIESCLTTWGWSSGTKEAIRQAARSSLSFTANAAPSCNAVWIDTSTGRQLYSRSFGSGAVSSSQSVVVSVSYSEYPESGSYEYESLKYSGDRSGTSTSQTYSQTYTASSSALTVTFYCHPKTSAKTGSITVIVKDADTKEPISGARVSGAGKAGNTGTNGALLFRDIALGTHTFSASKTGYSDGSGRGTITADQPETTVTIYLKKKGGGGGTPDPNPDEPEEGSVTVYVRDAETYAVLAGAYVSGSGLGGYTNSSGSITFYNLSAGSYTFTASRSGYSDGSGSARITASNPNPGITIYLTPQSRNEVPDDSGSVRVNVRESGTNRVISGAAVTGAGGSRTTNSSGYTTFAGLTPGTYTFTVSKSGYRSGSGTAAVTAGSTKTVTITLTPETEAPASGSVTVLVKDAVSGTPVSGASLSGSGLSGTTDGSGKAVFTGLTFGSYTVSASRSGYGSGSGTAKITSSEPERTILISLDPLPSSGTVTVTVLDRDTGNPISGASVSGTGTASSTASDGSVRFTGVPFGDYTVTAQKSGYESGTAAVSLSSSQPDRSVTVYLSRQNSDVGVSARAVNGAVYRGSTIMVSADVSGDARMDFTPDRPLTVTMKASRNGGAVFDTQSKPVICPAGKTNLVWVETAIPETGYSSPDVTFTFTVTPPAGTAESTEANNTSAKTVTTVPLPDRHTPDASFELDPPAGFTGSVSGTDDFPELTWDVWEWNAGFVRNTYHARLTASASLSPDSTAVWKVSDPAGTWKTRSGYGLNTEVTVRLTGLSDDMFAGNARVNASYPEFGYTDSADRTDLLSRKTEDPGGYSASFEYGVNADSVSGGRMHVTPIWFPDGAYTVKYEIYDLWTPAGMLTGTTYAGVRIEGSMYDDYYTQRN